MKINAGRTAAEKTALANKAYVPGSRRNLIQDDMSTAEPGSYALVVRYQDSQDPDSYWDHAFQVVVVPVEVRIPDQLYESYECYQNPYPTSFGGFCSLGEDC